jgi:undecaprenyl diphosphate synthase
MDGNGRWAEARGLPRLAGHKAGADVVERLVRYVANERLTRYLTLYAFSQENWRRPAREVDYLMRLFEEYLQEKTREFIENGIRLRFLGERKGLPDSLQAIALEAEVATRTGESLDLAVALNYSSREELASACRRVAQDVQTGELRTEAIDEAVLSERLYSSGLPDVDLLIRTSGERRLSNFLLWQIAYAELVFTERLWPDFEPDDFDAAVEEYVRRERRFGAA